MNNRSNLTQLNQTDGRNKTKRVRAAFDINANDANESIDAKRMKRIPNSSSETAMPALVANHFSIDDYINAMNTFQKFGYQPFIAVLDTQLQNAIHISCAKDIDSYTPSQIIPVDDCYAGRGGMLSGLGPTSSRFFLNTKDNTFYKASLSAIYHTAQNPNEEPKLAPVNPGGYVFAVVALKSSTGVLYLDVRFAKFTFTRTAVVEASGHRGLVDQKPLTSHAYYEVLPVKDNDSDKSHASNPLNTPYLANISKTAPAMCLAGEVYIQPLEKFSKDQNINPMTMFRVATAQTGNFNDVQKYHGTNQEVLIRFFFDKHDKFVFFPFPEQELSSFTRGSTEYQNRLHALKMKALDQGGFDFEDEPPIASAASSTPQTTNNTLEKSASITSTSSNLFQTPPTSQDTTQDPIHTLRPDKL